MNTTENKKEAGDINAIQLERRQGYSTTYETVHVRNLEELKDQLRQRNAARIELAIENDVELQVDFRRTWMPVDDLSEDDFSWLQHQYGTIHLWRAIRYD